MSVDVAAGRALYEITNTNLTPSETYKVYHDSDAVVNVAISTADATNPRIDIIVMKCDDSVDPNASSANIASIYAVAGTPAGSPAVPATPANHFKLYEVAVAAGATSIVNANLTDRRKYVKLDYDALSDVPHQGAIQDIPTAGGTGDAITVTLDSAPAAYGKGMYVIFKASASNTTTATANVSGLGTVTVKKWKGGSLSNLDAGDIPSGSIVVLYHDGTYFQLLSPAPSTQSVAGVGIFGSGSDGDATISGNTTLTADKHYNNLTINNGITLNPGGYRIFVAGTLTLTGTGKIAANGNAGGAGTTPSGGTGGPGGSAGSALASGYFPAPLAGVGGGAGGNAGDNGAGANASNGTAGLTDTNSARGATGAAGGAGGAGGTNPGTLGTGGAGGTVTTIASDILNAVNGVLGFTYVSGAVVFPRLNGGGGAGGGGAGGGETGSGPGAGGSGGGGGGSGSNGGYVLVCAKTITGAGPIEAKGGAGGVGGNGKDAGAGSVCGGGGGGGGGAGGSGGRLILIYSDKSSWSGAVSAAGGALGAGGTGGAGASGGTAGSTGSNGAAGTAGVAVELQF